MAAGLPVRGFGAAFYLLGGLHRGRVLALLHRAGPFDLVMQLRGQADQSRQA